MNCPFLCDLSPAVTTHPFLEAYGGVKPEHVIIAVTAHAFLEAYGAIAFFVTPSSIFAGSCSDSTAQCTNVVGGQPSREEL